MAVRFSCGCGAVYELKDELAGRSVQCPACGSTGRVGESPRVGAIMTAGDPAFDRDKYLLRQQHMAFNAKYDLCDEQNRPVLYIERPAHNLRMLAALLGGLMAGLAVAGVFAVGGVLAGQVNQAFGVALFVVAGVLGIATIIVVAVLLSPLRHITVYRNRSKAERLLHIKQVNKFQLPFARFELRDAAGELLARFEKNYLYNIVRKRWCCYLPDGKVLCLAKEDSIILSLLRRLIGTMFGALRTNFIFVTPGEMIIGEFNRKFTILDRYVLDLSADPQRTLDRRIAVALGVLLDTGERR